MNKTREFLLDALEEQLNDDLLKGLIEVINREYSYSEIMGMMAEISGDEMVADAYDRWNSEWLDTEIDHSISIFKSIKEDVQTEVLHDRGWFMEVVK